LQGNQPVDALSIGRFFCSPYLSRQHFSSLLLFSGDKHLHVYHHKMVFKIGIGIPINMDVTEWYAPGFGTVKTQSNSGDTQIVSIK